MIETLKKNRKKKTGIDKHCKNDSDLGWVIELVDKLVGKS